MQNAAKDEMLVLIRSLRSHIEADRELPGNVPSFSMQGPLPEAASQNRPAKGNTGRRTGVEGETVLSSSVPGGLDSPSAGKGRPTVTLPEGDAAPASQRSSDSPQILVPGPYRRFSVPEMPITTNGEGEVRALNNVRTDLGDCRRCALHMGRKNIVFGEGNPHAGLVFVGEAPGADEDDQGRPFVGRAGQLLTKIIEAMKMQRQDVYICNILKCRPPGNRNPAAGEIAACEPFLVKQLESIRPKVICALGTFAAQTLLKSDVAISLLRGKFHRYHNIPLMPTYHPAYLLRNPSQKRQVWEDVKQIMNMLADDSG
ncbi:MAG TPA: uracil-DNA glycosylase [Syntrophus sp. (in: bacteria)]|nr:uracil-DNA glycosylase [Syntrophus sp. (in: bacteria)]